MNNILALLLALTVLGGITLDLVLFDGASILFLLKKLAELIEWLAFWR